MSLVVSLIVRKFLVPLRLFLLPVYHPAGLHSGYYRRITVLSDSSREVTSTDKKVLDVIRYSSFLSVCLLLQQDLLLVNLANGKKGRCLLVLCGARSSLLILRYRHAAFSPLWHSTGIINIIRV